jgi:hypothetical protein
MMQTLLTAIIVAACAGYVVWALLLPAAARRRILRSLGRKAPASPACGCDGCDGPPAAQKAPQDQVVHWLPRKRG